MTKQELQEAFEQGLELQLEYTTAKIIQINDNIYFVSCNGSANLKIWTIDKFKEAKIISKPKYNGKAVKCYNVGQFKWLFNKLRPEALDVADSNFNSNNICIIIKSEYENSLGLCNNINYLQRYNYEIISFSDYCKEQGIEEPKWYQDFEVRDGYNDVIWLGYDNFTWHLKILKKVTEDYFIDIDDGEWIYAKRPKKDEFNINFAE